MSHTQYNVRDRSESEGQRALEPNRLWRKPIVIAGAFLVVGLGGIWLERKDLANDLLEREFKTLGIPARYEIVSISPSEQVIRNVSIGNPMKPDLTIQELRISTQLMWGGASIGRITIVTPRLHGSFQKGKMTFGSLDKVLFAGNAGKVTIPEIDVNVVDGGVVINSPYGKGAMTLTGHGPLQNGFTGKVSAIVPSLSLPGCRLDRAELNGDLTISSSRPRFVGPLQFKNLICDDGALHTSATLAQLDLKLDDTFAGGEGNVQFATGAVHYGAQHLSKMMGKGLVTYRDHGVNAAYQLKAYDVVTSHVDASELGFDGRIRTTGGVARFDLDGDLVGEGVALGRSGNEALLSSEGAFSGTLAAPIVAQIRKALERETRRSKLDASVVLRNARDEFSLVVPRASLKGGSGETLLALSRASVLFGKNAPAMSGNFTTGGQGLPKVWGRMETSSNHRLAMEVAMSDYRVGSASIGIPRLSLDQNKNGVLGFSGHVMMSGALPGGAIRNLLIPLDGRLAPNGDLAVWRECTDVRFDELKFSNLSLDKRSLTLCPSNAGSIVRGRLSNLRVAVGAPSLDLNGTLGQTPIRIASGPIGFAFSSKRPGFINASQIEIDLGPKETASHFSIDQLNGTLNKGVSGAFSEANISLAAIPLDLKQTSGNWAYADGIVSISDANLTLVDRQVGARFQPLIARDAILKLANNRISAKAVLREPVSDREIVRTDIVHNLSDGAGHAALQVEGVVFDKKLQADMLSRSLLGVVSGLQGKVEGSGHIDWDAQNVKSGGKFWTSGVDFAAAIGPVQGLSGEVVFTDLIGMVTAPQQVVRIATMNPGVEVKDGELSYEMKPGYYLQINGGHWPFMDGTLNLDPSHMQMGVAETRYYKLRVAGLNAATFVQHLELENVSATGTFDGELPLVFDENGGRVENGFLVSRAPGGNVSYIGALTYKDLSAMGNFAFDALKSVRYRNMEIGLGGSLAGDIVTRISFDGLSQGAGAKQNFLTKQIAKLPIRFVLNIKAPFFSLFGSMRSLYDPSYITDPRQLNIPDQQRDVGGVIRNTLTPPSATDIQPLVIEKKP